MNEMQPSLAIYIHVPFCLRRCHYCSFVSYAGRQEAVPHYVAAVRAEISRRGRQQKVGSIYFGGGTPSLLLLDQVAEVLGAVSEHFAVEKGSEITIEANPGTVTPDYLAGLKSLGINRLSLGMQSLDDRELALLGRLHTAAEAVAALEQARRAGFDNINVDLIYGLPGQSLGEWQQTLEAALALAPDHLSLYALTPEEGTLLQKQIDGGILPSIDPDVCADQYELAEAMLADRGYRHYEISNWSRPGKECRHNLVYWRNLPYLGFGVAAHSFINGHRMANTTSLDRYLSGTADTIEFDEKISPDLEMAETLILCLRQCEGVNLPDVDRRFGTDVLKRYCRQIEEMVELGLLEFDGANLRLTRRGRLLGNEVFWRFLPDEAPVTG